MLSDQLREGKPQTQSLSTTTLLEVQIKHQQGSLFGMRKHCYISAVQSRIQDSVLVPHRNLNQPSLKQEKCITASFRQHSYPTLILRLYATRQKQVKNKGIKICILHTGKARAGNV